MPARGARARQHQRTLCLVQQRSQPVQRARGKRRDRLLRCRRQFLQAGLGRQQIERQRQMHRAAPGRQRQPDRAVQRGMQFPTLIGRSDSFVIAQ